MSLLNDALLKDIASINKIDIVPTLLEVVCRATGMGFSAIARVTNEKWIACSVRDEIDFGLRPGGELMLETTICNEIRQSNKGVYINNVDASAEFCDHHTPKMYGFKSYISLPIILNNGEFFGTLCAIDPRPRVVDDVKTVGMFTLFTQLIAFHLAAIEAMEQSAEQLTVAQDENKRYEHLTYHSLREPVRKIGLYSDKLLQESEDGDKEKIRTTAAQINKFSIDLAGMLTQLPG